MELPARCAAKFCFAHFKACCNSFARPRRTTSGEGSKTAMFRASTEAARIGEVHQPDPGSEQQSASTSTPFSSSCKQISNTSYKLFIVHLANLRAAELQAHGTEEPSSALTFLFIKAAVSSRESPAQNAEQGHLLPGLIALYALFTTRLCSR